MTQNYSKKKKSLKQIKYFRINLEDAKSSKQIKYLKINVADKKNY